MLVQRAYKVTEQVKQLDGTAQGRMIVLPSYLPDPLFIVSAELMNQGGFYSPTAGGFLQIQLDRGGRFAPTGWPPGGEQLASDPVCQEELFRLALIVAKPNGSLFTRNEFNPPVSYSRSRGDKILIDNSGIGMDYTQLVWTLNFLDEDTREVNFSSRPK